MKWATATSFACLGSLPCWAKELPEGADKQNALNSLGYRWAEEDPEAAAAYAQSMPGGNAHHGQLDWPWANNRSRLDTPDQQWGVPTGLPRLFLAGAGARRGGVVSGVPGHNAAMAVLASR